MKKSGNLFKLRDSTKNDEKLILDWANDKEVRKNSFIQKNINKGEHRKWFKNMLEDSNFTQYIMIDLKNRPIGQVRFEVKGKFAFIDISIDSIFRGKGLSAVLLGKSFAKYFLENKTEYSIIAEVKENNLSSIALFSSFNYKFKEYNSKNKTFKFTFDFQNEELIKSINSEEFKNDFII